MQKTEYSPLLRWAGRSLKYFGFTLFGVGCACILSKLLGVSHLGYWLITQFGVWLWRCGVAIVAFLSIAMIIESLWPYSGPTRSTQQVHPRSRP